VQALLGSLLCLVLAASQSFAVSGGPPYPGGSTSIVGTYAGVLEPRFDPTDPFSTNSLGIFSLGVPGTGLATGNFIMFVRGTVFKGTIQGLGNPNDGTVRGILDASFSITTSEATTTSGFGFIFTTSATTVAARAQGNLNATVIGGRSGSATSATLLRGTADLFVSQAAASPTPTPTTSPGASPSPSPSPTGGSGGVTAAFTLDVAGFRQSTTAVGPVTVGTGQ
jgi:hypothetical protein